MNDLAMSYIPDINSVAVVGMSARFPGAPNIGKFWANLCAGVESVKTFSSQELRASGVPQNRIEDDRYVRRAAVLENIDRFDAELFDINDYEAEILDPQHRLFLQCCWEALENAGYNPLGGNARTGVFAGASISTYLLYNLAERLDRSGADFNLATLLGNDKDYLATYVAYKLNLTGPAISVQTACSTSLVAVHQAAQALLNGECDKALAGGVTVRIPHSVGYQYQGGSMLSPDGHCRAFDEQSAGTVPGSGLGVVVLKRLADALADADQIYAVIKGSAVNNDGSQRNGFTTPSVSGQAQVIADAHAVAGIRADSISYVETHGTGTKLGDPIEIEALTRAFRGESSKLQYCAIGSVKTNFGHLESAAGVAGLIKTILCLHHKQLVPICNFTKANNNIDFSKTPFYVNSCLQDWKPVNGLRRAGVSSFGFGGTNCHVIVEEYRETQEASDTAAQPEERPVQVLTLSAKTASALQALAARYQAVLAEPANRPALGNVAYTANVGRAHFAHRLAILAADSESAAHELQSYLQGQPGSGVITGEAPAGDRPGIVFMFTGQGAQYVQMGRSLYETQSVYRRELDSCNEVFEEQLGRSISSVLYQELETDLVDQTAYTQPLLYCLEYALARLWESWGVRADAVLGHSVGEYVAACIAGVYDCADGLRLVCARSRLMGALPPGGAMAAVYADKETVENALGAYTGRLSIAGYNSSTNIVISGEQGALETVCAELSGKGVETRRLKVSHGFHSPLIEPVLDEFEAVAATVTYREPQIRLISSLTARELQRGELSAVYWRRHAREPVRYAQSVQAAYALGYKIYLEVGPHPVLSALGRQTVEDSQVLWLCSLRRGGDDVRQLMDSLARLYTAGVTIDWKNVDRDYHRQRVALPTYPFTAKRYWISPGNESPAQPQQMLAGQMLLHKKTVPDFNGCRFEGAYSLASLPWLRDHCFREQSLMPLTGYIEICAQAFLSTYGTIPEFRDLHVHTPMIFGETSVREIQLEWQEQPSQDAGFCVAFSIRSKEKNSRDRYSKDRQIKDKQPQAGWQQHARGRLLEIPGESAIDNASRTGIALDEPLPGSMNQKQYYRRLAGQGMNYGENFQNIAKIRYTSRQSLAVIQRPVGINTGGLSQPRFVSDPMLLDSCLQSAGILLQQANQTSYYLPTSIKSIRLHRRVNSVLTSHAVISGEDPNKQFLNFDIGVYDQENRSVVEIQGLRFNRVSDCVVFCEPVWKPIPLSAEEIGNATNTNTARDTGGVWIIFADRSGVAKILARQLERAGAYCFMVTAGEQYEENHRQFVLRMNSAVDYRRMFKRILERHTVTGIVYAWEPDEARDKIINARLRLKHIYQPLLHLIQTLISLSQSEISFFYANVSRANSVKSPSAVLDDILRGGATALLKSVVLEHPNIQAVSVTTDCVKAREAANRLFVEITQFDGEKHIKWENNTRFGLRLTAYPHSDKPIQPYYRLSAAKDGILDSLYFAPDNKTKVPADHIGIKVLATGLNFRDILLALGVYPGDAPLGIDCAGEIFALGEGVDGFELGQRVITVAPGCFASHVSAPRHLVVPMPRGMSYVEAAALPTALLTAYSALVTLAKLKPGEKVLIHCATGGVGLAAIRIAQQIGAEILATAGSPEKRDYLSSLGVPHVLDSRSMAFAGKINTITNHSGVDVVLNSLAGDFIPMSLSVVAPEGRFIEIGKSGIWPAEKVRRLYPGLQYHVLDLERQLKESPQKIGDLLYELIERYAGGLWRKMPVKTFPRLSVTDAFKYMQQSRHIGKTVVVHDHAPQVSSQASYLITGALGSLGLKLAKHLVQCGAGCVILAGRRHASDDRLTAQLQDLARGGAKVVVKTTDVSSQKAVDALFSEIHKTCPPLRGVFHAAGVVEDGIVENLDWRRVENVLKPKALGAWHIHNATKEAALDYFVLYSSLTSLVGAAGQANYVTANGVLDALVHYRRSLGLPAISINWGPWDAGMTARLARTEEEKIRSLGLLPLRSPHGFQLQDEAIAAGYTQVGIAAVDLPVFQKHFLRLTTAVVQFPGPSDSTGEINDESTEGFKDEQVQDGIPADNGQEKLSTDNFLHELQNLPASQRWRCMQECIIRQTVRVLRVDKSNVKPSQSLLELGLDSLMAVEFRNYLSKLVNAQLPSTLLFDYPTIEGLTAFLLKTLALLPENTRQEEKPFSNERNVERNVENLSKNELIALLEHHLEEWGERT